MESSEEYKSALNVLKQLEKQQVNFNEATLMQAHAELTKSIESDFAKCYAALGDRKAALLREIDVKFHQKQIFMPESRKQFKDTVHGCKEIINTGALLYSFNRRAAVQIWKSVNALSSPNFDEEKIKNVPLDILRVITEDSETPTRQRASSTDYEVQLKKTRIDLPPPPFIVQPLTPPTKPIPPQPLSVVTAMVLDDPRSDDFKRIDKIITLASCTKEVKAEQSFELPRGILLNPIDDCLYFCDSGDFTVKKLTRSGEVSLFAGKHSGGELQRPFGIAINSKTNTFYVTNLGSNTISKITHEGKISLFAGDGTRGNKDGIGENSSFNNPHGIAIDQHTGNIYVADCDGHTIRKITPQGHVSTFAGSGKAGYFDAFGKTAQFNKPWGIFFDEVDQFLYVCDAINNKLRRVNPNGQVTTVCNVENPSCVVVTSNRTILVTSFMPKNISKIQPTTKGGYESIVIASADSSVDSAGKPIESFKAPYGLAVDERTNSCFVGEYFEPAFRQILFSKSS